MATYETVVKQDLVRHEGNLADIQIEFTNVNLIGVDVNIQVRNNKQELILEKSTLDSETSQDISINDSGNVLTIILNPEDTKGNPGKHNYEIDFLDSEQRPYMSIRGLFEIIAEINKT